MQKYIAQQVMARKVNIAPKKKKLTLKDGFKKSKFYQSWNKLIPTNLAIFC